FSMMVWRMESRSSDEVRAFATSWKMFSSWLCRVSRVPVASDMGVSLLCNKMSNNLISESDLAKLAPGYPQVPQCIAFKVPAQTRGSSKNYRCAPPPEQ